ncbi:MAG TPA: TIGR02466 family protein, partial [Verrucomicrobiota bacterium]|nr:TIGR02466 family protein [Verrucomicrobiota bacterium]
MNRVQAWFPTFLYCDRLLRARGRQFNQELLTECRQLREFDDAGRRWSAKNYPGGYTSYGSMDKLHQFSSTFGQLEQHLNRHARAFARALDWDLGHRRLVMTDCWVNIMPHRTAHSLHLHPNSVVSGTYYVATPRGCAGLKFEDPRLSRFMAAPPRSVSARRANQVYVTYPATAGQVLLFESWLR